MRRVRDRGDAGGGVGRQAGGSRERDHDGADGALVSITGGGLVDLEAGILDHVARVGALGGDRGDAAAPGGNPYRPALVVEQFEEIRAARESNAAIDPKWLVLANQVTDANAVLFDAVNNFRGCLSGINEVLRRQGLVQTAACLSEDEQLSPGQAEEIDRIYRSYPHLTDDDFVRANLDDWLSG